MLAWHAAATVVLATVLSRGDRIIAHLGEVLVPVVALRPFRAGPVRVPSATRPVRDTPRSHRQVCRHAVSRRGPPLRWLPAA
jgi:hypothetical protein